MKKLVVLLICLFILLSPIAAASKSAVEYKPYVPMPIWTMNMRRGSSLFLGSMVFTMPIASIIYSFVPHSHLSDISNFGYTTLIASGLSMSIVAADYIIGINE